MNEVEKNATKQMNLQGLCLVEVAEDSTDCMFLLEQLRTVQGEEETQDMSCRGDYALPRGLICQRNPGNTGTCQGM